jgi:hypothetical protein
LTKSISAASGLINHTMKLPSRTLYRGLAASVLASHSLGFVPNSFFSREVHHVSHLPDTLATNHLPLTTTEVMTTITRSSSATDEEETNTMVSNEEVSEELKVVLSFVQLVQTISPGELSDDEAALLREAMVSLPSVMEANEESATMNEILLHRMIGEWKAAISMGNLDKISLWEPSLDDFKSAILAWEKIAPNSNAVVHALSILSDQREIYQSGVATVKPDIETFEIVLRTMASVNQKGLDRRARLVFDSLGDYDLEPSVSIYSFMIQILARSRGKHAAANAEDLLREAVDKFPPQLMDGAPFGIGRDSFNVVLTAWAKSEEDYGPKRAEELVGFMDWVDEENGGHRICNPNIQSFTSVIDAYAQKRDWFGAQDCEMIFNRVLDLYLEGDEDLEPNVATWTIVISAWAKLAKKNFQSTRKNAKTAEDKALNLLRRMEALYEDGRISYGPDRITYLSCLNGFCASKSESGPTEAEAILNELYERYLDGEDEFKIRAKDIRNVVDAWVRFGQMSRAEALIDRYEDILHDEDDPEAADSLEDIYRIMLSGWSRQDDTTRAKVYLDEIIASGVKVDGILFERIIDANSKIGTVAALKKSYGVFEIAEKLRQEERLVPTERLYNSFIRALTKSKDPAAPKKSLLLLNRMKTLFEQGNNEIRPTTFTYNAILYACSEAVNVKGSDLTEAFTVAVKAFNELRKNEDGVDPDHMSFGNMLRCSALLPEGDKRDGLIVSTFKLCCQNGFVNTYVLRDLQYAAPEAMWRSLVGLPLGELTEESIPPEWRYRFESRKQNRPRREYNRSRR